MRPTPLDYGIDAPRLVRAFAALGVAAAGGTVAFAAIGWGWAAGPSGIVALYGLGMATLMLAWSRSIKVRERDRMLDTLNWRGDEHVLDVGCGRGLMLVGAALRLAAGRGMATGIDIWRAEDQSANGPQAPIENARRMGVADRVIVQTADMRALPFVDASFDVVLSHWVVHNLDDAGDRDLALAEMARVLRPGGTIVLADIAHREDYAARLAAAGFADQRRIAPMWRDVVLRAVSFGSFRPGWIIARRG